MTFVPPPTGEREVAREKLRASIERLNARGLDGEAIAQKAAENLRYWSEHPAPWDYSFVPPDFDDSLPARSVRA